MNLKNAHPSSPADDAVTVLVVMPLAEQRGGGELMLRLLVQHGRGREVDWVIVFLENGPMVREFRRLGLKVAVVDAGRLREPHRFLAAVARIARVAHRERATVILGWMSKGQLYAGPAALLAQAPVIWYQLGAPGPRDWLDRLATAIPARGVIVLSQVGSSAQASIRPVRLQRTVYPGAELDRFDPSRLPVPEELRARLELPLAGPLVGIVGRLQRWKGVHVLIDAVSILRRDHPRVHCVVVGGPHDLEPEYELDLKRQVAARELGPHVTFAGIQTNIPEWMNAMDVVVHASDQEPFGIVVVEAMALGKPVVAGAEGGPREIINDGVNGLLVSYGDSVGLARAIRRYLDDPEFAEAVGAAARVRAVDFSAATYAEKLMVALRELSA